MVRRLRVWVFVGGLLFLWQCKPDEKAPVPPDAFVTSLTGSGTKTWRLQNLAMAGSSQPIPNCRQEDRWTFQSNTTCAYQNPTMCGSGDIPSFSGRWRTSNNNRFLVVDTDGGITYSYEVIQLSENLLVWEYIGQGGELIQETWVP